MNSASGTVWSRFSATGIQAHGFAANTLSLVRYRAGVGVRSAAVWGLRACTGRGTYHVFMCTLLLRTRGERSGFHLFSKRRSRKEREERGKGLEGKRDK